MHEQIVQKKIDGKMKLQKIQVPMKICKDPNFVAKPTSPQKPKFSLKSKISDSAQRLIDSGQEKIKIEITGNGTIPDFRPKKSFGEYYAVVDLTQEQRDEYSAKSKAYVKKLEKILTKFIENNGGKVTYQSDLSNTLYAEIPIAFVKELEKRTDILYIDRGDRKLTTTDCRPDKPCGGLPRTLPIEMTPKDTNTPTIIYGTIFESGCSTINGKIVQGSARKGALVGNLCKFNDEYYVMNKDTICPEVLGFMKYAKTGEIFAFGHSCWQPSVQNNSWIKSSDEEYQNYKQKN
ncbi:MAG: hypothetical protein HZC29_03100 [Thaumarchaeota archaeon]|nr:hypothetical protein [Nitrososphaerota archaeon]